MGATRYTHKQMLQLSRHIGKELSSRALISASIEKSAADSREKFSFFCCHPFTATLDAHASIVWRSTYSKNAYSKFLNNVNMTYFYILQMKHCYLSKVVKKVARVLPEWGPHHTRAFRRKEPSNVSIYALGR